MRNRLMVAVVGAAASAVMLLGGLPAAASPAVASDAAPPLISWPTPDVRMQVGVQVAVYGTVKSTTPVAVSVQDASTGTWLQSDGAWAQSRATFSAPIVDAAGTWRWMYTPATPGRFTLFASAGSSPAQQTTFTVIPVAQPAPVPTTTPTPSPPTGSGTLLAPGAPNPYLHSGLGEFVAQCTPGKLANEDPIVDPGNPNFFHLHQFFGNTSTNYASTYDTLKAKPTTCDPAVDASAYWIPAVLKDGVPVAPTRTTVYYQVSYPQDPAKVTPFPAGLKMVAGSAMARTDQPDSVVQWTCIGASTISATIPDCHGQNLNLLVQFPDCWDSTNLDSANHKSHLTYSRGQSCPASHPVLLPSTQFRIEFPVSGAGVTLSSDAPMMGVGRAQPGQSAHGDLFNAWDTDALAQRVTTCLNAARVCDTSGRVIR